MNTIDKYTLLPNAINRIKITASKGVWHGKDINDSYFQSCRWLLEYYPCTILYTKEVGYHSSGWWKNPEYERCWHLSISFKGGKNKVVLEKIVTHLFGEYKKWIWVEPPYSEQGKQNDVWHYRLFCDKNWQPIKPKGEVYNTQFTEVGWKSFSELNA